MNNTTFDEFFRCIRYEGFHCLYILEVILLRFIRDRPHVLYIRDIPQVLYIMYFYVYIKVTLPDVT